MALAGVAADIEGRGGQVAWVAADCTETDEVARVAAATRERFGSVDIVVPFAGGDGMPVPTERETAGHWRQVLDTDLTSAFVTVAAFLPEMIERQRGVIVSDWPSWCRG